jgi:hypothetical protein
VRRTVLRDQSRGCVTRGSNPGVSERSSRAAWIAAPVIAAHRRFISSKNFEAHQADWESVR